MEKVLSIDVHNHAIPEEYVRLVRKEGAPYGATVDRDGGGKEWLHFGSGVRTLLRPRFHHPKLRLEDMDAAGLDMAAVSFLPTDLFYWASQEIAARACHAVNVTLAGWASAYPQRFVAMATVPVQYPDEAARELERCVQEHHMTSVQIGCIVEGQNLDEPKFQAFFEAAQALDVLVFVHPTHNAAEPALRRYYLNNFIGNPVDTAIAAASLIFGGVLDRFPALKVCLAHGGGAAPYLRGRWAHGYAVRPEAKVHNRGAFDDYFGRFSFDSLTHFGPALEYLVGSVGSSKVVIGTDCPADMGNLDQVAVVRSLDIAPEQKQQILSENALRLLKIKGEQTPMCSCP